jgi:hypothetical protein
MPFEPGQSGNRMTATISPEQFLDPRWRLSNLYTIIDKKGKAVPFRPWD